MSDLDERIAARPAPKVTPDDIKRVIAGEQYHRLTNTLTVCVLTLENGFTVTGQSACASPENYDETIGNELARRDAENKIWSLEAYLLRQTLAYHESGGQIENAYHDRAHKWNDPAPVEQFQPVDTSYVGTDEEGRPSD